MDDESVPKSAFVTHFGLYEFVCVPFGMCNAPATFQQHMETVLTDLLWKECFAYLVDVLVSSPDSDGYLKSLKVFDRIQEAGLHLKAQKSGFY